MMTCEPLMLSDTAMVLLREYDCVDEDGRAMLFDPFLDDPRLKAPVEWDNFSVLLHYQAHLRDRLLEEIWILWTHQDIQVTRHLDWHLVFDETLMALAQKAFFSSRSYKGSEKTRHPSYDQRFMTALFKAYKNTLAARAKPPAPDKDHP